jgi:hypothetical protein
VILFIRPIFTGGGTDALRPVQTAFARACFQMRSYRSSVPQMVRPLDDDVDWICDKVLHSREKLVESRDFEQRRGGQYEFRYENTADSNRWNSLDRKCTRKSETANSLKTTRSDVSDHFNAHRKSGF